MSPGQPPGIANTALAALTQAAARRRAEREELAKLRDDNERMRALTRQLLREHQHSDPHHEDICAACIEAAKLEVTP